MADTGGSLASFWRSLPHAWTHDTRDPSFSFGLQNGQVWNFYAMSVTAWSELLLMIVLEAMLAALLSIFLYKFAVRKQGTLLSYLVCYAVVVPVVTVGPFAAFKVLKVRNQLFRFCLGAIVPVTCLFKTTAVAHGFVPAYAKHSVKSFAFFYACPMLLERDPKLDKFVPTTSSDFIGSLKGCFVMVAISGALVSFFQYIPGVMPPLGQGNLPPDSDWYSLSSFLHPERWLLRNYFFGIYFQVIISLFGEGLILAQCLVTGYKTRILMDNPLFSARSFTQFWGSKWNLVIHDVLKIGVYLPLRKYIPKQSAMLSTFIASGLFHEALLWIFSYPLDDTDGCFSDPSAIASKAECYRPYFFTTTIFFLWQATLIALEHSPLGRLSIWSKVPDGVAAFLIVTAMSPFGHYFVEPYWNSLCFESALPMMYMLKPATTAV